MSDRVSALKALAAKWNHVWEDFCSPRREKARKARESTRRLRRLIENESGATAVYLGPRSFRINLSPDLLARAAISQVL
jgi:hypothetical protein